MGLHSNTCTLFPALSPAKLKESIFVWPQIREVLKDNVFEEFLTLNEPGAWEAFKSFCHGFLGNKRVLDHQESIEKLLPAYKDKEYRM